MRLHYVPLSSPLSTHHHNTLIKHAFALCLFVCPSLREKVALRIQECDELRGYIKEKLQLTHKKNQESKNNLDYTRTLLLEASKIRELEDNEGDSEEDRDSDDDDNTEDNDTIQDSSTGQALHEKNRRRKSSRSGRSMSIQSLAPSGMPRLLSFNLVNLYWHARVVTNLTEPN